MSMVAPLRFGAALLTPAPAVGVRLAREWASTRSPDRWPAPPLGDGAPALLVPGFLAGDASLGRLGAWLRQGRWDTHRSGILTNVDCTERLIARLEARAEAIVARADGRRALIVGQSRGGALGRILAVRRPDLVETLVTLGSPVCDLLAVHPRTRLAVTAVGALGTVGVPGLLSTACRAGPCCARARDELAATFPPDVRYIAVYSRCDEVVRREACLDPAAELVEVATSHLGMGFDAGVWRAIAARLGHEPAWAIATAAA